MRRPPLCVRDARRAFLKNAAGGGPCGAAERALGGVRAAGKTDRIF